MNLILGENVILSLIIGVIIKASNQPAVTKYGKT